MKKLFAIAIVAALLTQGCGTGMPRWSGRGDLSAGPEIMEGGVKFSIYAPQAERVNIVGDFNNWSTTADPLYDREGNGLWSIILPLTPGRYEYKFLIDGKSWVPDPGNEERVDDGFGGQNAVLSVEEIQ